MIDIFDCDVVDVGNRSSEVDTGSCSCKLAFNISDGDLVNCILLIDDDIRDGGITNDEFRTRRNVGGDSYDS